MMRSFFLITLLLAAGTWCPAQVSGRCVLPVSIIDSESQSVIRVDVSDLKIRVGDATVPILSLKKQAPSNVVLLLDSSRQMSGDNIQRNRQLLLLYWLAASAPSQVGLLAYTGKIDGILQGKETVLSELRSRGSREEILGGESAFMPALLQTAKAMRSAPGDAIFVIGPAFMPTLRSDREELLRILQQRGIRLFYMQFSFSNYRANSNNLVAELTKEARESGGEGFTWPELSGPKSAIEDVRDRLVNEMYRYFLVEFDRPSKEPQDAPIIVTLTDSTSSAHLLFPARAICK